MPVVPHFSPVLRTPLPGLFLTRALLGALLKLAVVRSQRTKSFQNPKVLNASEDAHLKIMSTFETHLQGLRHHAPSHGVRCGITLDWVRYSTVADEHI